MRSASTVAHFHAWGCSIVLTLALLAGALFLLDVIIRIVQGWAK